MREDAYMGENARKGKGGREMGLRLTAQAAAPCRDSRAETSVGILEPKAVQTNKKSAKSRLREFERALARVQGDGAANRSRSPTP